METICGSSRSGDPAGVILPADGICAAGINTGEFSQGLFQASLFGAMAAAVLGYAIWLVYRLLNKKQQGKQERV